MAALRSMVSVRAAFICGFGQSAAMTAGSSALTFMTKTLGPVVMLPTNLRWRGFAIPDAECSQK